MGNINSRNFNMPVLIRFGDLDINKLSRNNPSLTAGDFFWLLSKYMDYAPRALEILTKISIQKAGEFDFKELSHLGKDLEGLGCFKYSQDLDEIISAGKRGHYGFAAECTDKIKEDFARFNARLVAASKPEVLVEVPDMEEIASEDNTTFYKSQTLKRVLQFLNQEEEIRKLRILAVDDAPVMLKTISSILEDEYKVYCMTDPQKVEDFLHQITPELFILDYKMPELNGFDLIPIIRNFEEHKETPIIFLTSLGTPDHVSAALTLGACDFIVKPFQGNILKEKVAKHIVRKKLL
ncbi:MAG: response regulator [Treponema sp.]|nr:response regulator [Treponema sp.]